MIFYDDIMELVSRGNVNDTETRRHVLGHILPLINKEYAYLSSHNEACKQNGIEPYFEGDLNFMDGIRETIAKRWANVKS